jgi:hypothetical protein
MSNQEEVSVALNKLPEQVRAVASTLVAYLKRGARKSSFYYRSKTTGREGKYVVDLGIDYGTAKQESLNQIKKYQEWLLQNNPEHEDIAVAEGILNPKPRKPSSFNLNKISLGHGISIAPTKDSPNDYKLYIYAYIDKAVGVDEVVEPTSTKKISPAEDLHKRLETKLSRFRQFILSPEHIAGITYKGGIIELHNDETI